jgi:hypothetical protein
MARRSIEIKKMGLFLQDGFRVHWKGCCASYVVGSKHKLSNSVQAHAASRVQGPVGLIEFKVPSEIVDASAFFDKLFEHRGAF